MGKREINDTKESNLGDIILCGLFNEDRQCQKMSKEVVQISNKKVQFLPYSVLGLPGDKKETK
jgi:hypothetical protein